jgi:peptide/nickel transport system permease protein
MPVIIVNASIRMGEVVLLASTLAFLGFGPPPPFPAWGRMLQESQTQLQYHPNLAIFPGLAIVLTVYAFNMLGDALRDVLDPRLRHIR